MSASCRSRCSIIPVGIRCPPLSGDLAAAPGDLLGVGVYSVTIIVAAFMVGLGLGSLAGGRLADRIGARACLWGFAIAELGIGVFGLLSKRLYYDILYVGFPYLAASPAVASAVLLASLLWPTVSMGCRCRCCRARSPPAWE